MTKPFAWSYSALARYEQCPKQYYHINVAKDVKDEFSSEQGNEGDLIHKALYKRVVKGEPLPLPFRHFEKTAAKFADTKGEKHGEIRLALNRDFEQTDYFAKDVYLRAIIDLLVVTGKHALVVDWKTGKVKPEFTQLAMSAAVLSQCMPELETFTIAYVWLKHKNLSTKRYTRAELLEIWSDLIPRANRVEKAIKTTDFPAKPSGLCGWCPVTSCPEWRERD